MADYYGTNIKSIKVSLYYVLKPILSDLRSNFIYSLVANWDRIFSAKYARYCKLSKVSMLNEGKRCNIIVESHNSATSFYLNNNTQFLLDKINSLFGYQAVLKIMVKEVPKIV